MVTGEESNMASTFAVAWRGLSLAAFLLLLLCFDRFPTRAGEKKKKGRGLFLARIASSHPGLNQRDDAHVRLVGSFDQCRDPKSRPGSEAWVHPLAFHSLNAGAAFVAISTSWRFHFDLSHLSVLIL
jgi:hypothetical protein